MPLLITLISAPANLFLGLMVYLRNRRGVSNILFALFSLTVSFWAISNYFSLIAIGRYLTHEGGTPEGILFWMRVVMVDVAMMFPLLYLFTANFPSTRLNLSPYLLGGVLLFSVATQIISTTPLLFQGIQVRDGTVVPVPGPAIILYALHAIGFPVLTTVTLWKKWRSSQGTFRSQLLLLLWGVSLTFFLAILTNFILVNVFHNSSLVVFGPLFTAILIGLTMYAITRYQLLDIKLIVARAVSFLFIIGAVALAYALLFFGIAQFISGVRVSTPLFLGGVALTVLAMLSFQTIAEALRRFTNSIFFKGVYDRGRLLSDLTHIMAETIEIDRMTNAILAKLTTAMHISKAAFLIVDNHEITGVKGRGYVDHEFAVPKLEKLLHEKFGSDHHVVFEDMEESLLKTLFRRLDIALAIPMWVEAEEVAILILGSKLSGEIYYQQDLEVLDVFASEAGIAIQNAKAYDAIKKFSRELEQRVEERTKELKETQERELAKAREVARLKDEFVFIAAHELRAPVTAIRGFLELMEKEEKKLKGAMKENLGYIAQASTHLHQLINDLLEISRTEAGTIRINVSPQDIVPLIKAVLEELAPLAEEKSVTLKSRIDKLRPVLCDSNKMRVVLTNLVSNAVKYNRVGGETEVSAYTVGNRTIIEVRDTGYGIPKDQQEKIFQKFFRAYSPETRDVIGTGLGLFISRMLVERMGGEIGFSSKEGEGTTFSFSLNVA